MQNCKKYKPNATVAASHHRNPKGDCKGCVYFSKFNCRMHMRTGEGHVVFG